MNSRGIRAFSLGIILSVSTIGSYYYLANAKDMKISDGAAKAQLTNKGYVILTSEEYKKIKQQATEGKDVTQPEITKNEEKGESPPAPIGGEPVQAEKEKKVIVYNLEVGSGMSSGEIADLLAANKIIESQREFRQFLISNKYQTNIQVGTFELTNEMSYQQIAKIITKN
jgi:hypothetical protein